MPHSSYLQVLDTYLPAPIKLHKVEARVCKVGSLMFLILGPKYYQICPQGGKRIGRIGLTVVPWIYIISMQLCEIRLDSSQYKEIKKVISLAHGYVGRWCLVQKIEKEYLLR